MYNKILEGNTTGPQNIFHNEFEYCENGTEDKHGKIRNFYFLQKRMPMGQA